jgi:predicted nucleic acid-binding protein
MRAALQPPYVEVLPFTPEVSDRYGQIRAANKVTAGDAIHLATAAAAGVNLFLTNDAKLKNLTIPGIDFVAGLDVNVF